MESSKPVKLKLAWATTEAAKHACLYWHYNKSFPVGRLAKIGVWEDDVYKGVVIFGRGATPHIGSPFGLEQNEIAEMCRIALNGHTTAISRIMSIALKMLRKENPGLRMVITYADPAAGHLGKVYQASNWYYIGRGTDIMKVWWEDKWMHPRTMAEIRKRLKAQGMKMPKLIAKTSPGYHRYVYLFDPKMMDVIKPMIKPFPTEFDDPTATTAVEADEAHLDKLLTEKHIQDEPQ